MDLFSITYLSDGLRVKGYLALPRSAQGALPSVIYNRGGNRDFGALTDVRAMFTCGLIASWGYCAVASQYRGNAGGDGQEEFGGVEVNDILNLIPLLENHSKADAFDNIKRARKWRLTCFPNWFQSIQRTRKRN